MTVNQNTFDCAMSRLLAERQGQDVADIMNVAHRSFGIGMSPCEAEVVWKWWSEKSAAQWLNVNTADIQTAIVEFIKSHE